MFPVLGAASSAIDALKALTSTKPPAGANKDAANLFAFSADASASSGASSGSGGGTSSSISPETMNALFAAQSQSGPDASASMRSGSLKQWFARVDSDKDGNISKPEFEALGAGGSNGTRSDAAFSKLDTDGDGSINPAELLAALKGKRKRPDQQSDPLLQALQGTSGTSATDADAAVTVTASKAAASSYNFMDQLIQRQSSLIPAQASSSLSVSV